MFFRKMLFFQDTGLVLTTSKKMQNKVVVKVGACFKWVLVVSKRFNVAVNDFDTMTSASSSQVLIVTELIISGT